MTQPSISIVISTYNWPEALSVVLHALNQNNEDNIEVIIADDGSSEQTLNTLKVLPQQLNFPLHLIRQDDKGFRVGRIRNKAIQKAKNDYVIFLDQDTVPRADFIKQHRLLAEIGYFVSGSRIFLNDELTQSILKNQTDLTRRSFFWYLRARINKQCNRCLPMLRLTLPPFLRKTKINKWKGTKNLLGIWRKDLLAINGYDEAFIGWGYEDSDLVCRLLANGIKRKEGKFATEVMHLHHPIVSRKQADSNYHLLQDTLLKKRPLFTQKGISESA